MQPLAEVWPPLESEITRTTASAAIAAMNAPTSRFSRSERRRPSRTDSAWPGGRISTGVSLGGEDARPSEGERPSVRQDQHRAERGVEL